MKILLFSDLHEFEKEKIDNLNIDCDIIIFLGDINATPIRYIIQHFGNKEYFGVLGNHDDKNLYDSINKINKLYKIPSVENIHLKLINKNNITFTGLEGSEFYGNHPGFTQEEALNLNIPKADIFFSHETGYHYIKEDIDDPIHQGFKTISKYIKEQKPKYHFFGHHHVNCEFKIGNTYCYGIYGCSLFDYNKNAIKRIF